MPSMTEHGKLIEKPVLDQARQKKAREYSRTQRRLGLAETGWSLALILAFIFSGGANWFAGLFDWSSVAAAVAFFVTLIVAYEILTFPFSYYSHTLSRRYGISTQKLGGWLADVGKGSVLSLVLGAGAMAVIYWLLNTFPDFWWLIAWALILVFSLLMGIISPVFIVPLFYKVRPLADEDLKARLQQLTQKARTQVKGIYTLDFSSKMTAANAALMGIGQTRRIVLSDTLLNNYSVPEIEVITAHELGHHVNRDVFRLFIVQAGVFLVGLKIVDSILRASFSPLGFNGIGDPASLPWLVLILGIFSVLASPLTNFFTRYVEGQADEYAINLTDDPEAFIDSMTRLANQNLAVAYPKRWEEVLLHDHPSYRQRVERARKYEGEVKS